jgi:dihydroflavonol-4-reductase
MLCFVTGGAGFIGSHVVRELLKRNYKVRILAQGNEPLFRVTDLPVEIVKGDLLDLELLEKCVAGCDYAFHLAAIHKQWMADYTLMYRVNIEGTRNVMAACLKEGIKRVVYTSTQNVIGFNSQGPADENTPFLDYKRSSHYTKSKYLAEQEVLKFAEKGLDVIIVNPSGPFGEGDTGPTGQLVLDFLHQKIPFYFDGWFNVIDVRDLAIGHLLALEKGRKGERYIMGGRDLSIKEFFALLEKLSGIPSPKFRLPKEIALCLGIVLEFIADHLTHRPPKMSVDRVQQRSRKKLLNVQKAIALGLPQTPIEDSLQRSIDWYRQHDSKGL